MVKRILIAGGGIGGLSASLGLAEVGFDVQVFEQANAFVEIGAGVQITPNGARVLHRLGLEKALRSVSSLPQRNEIRQWNDGKLLFHSLLGDEGLQRFGFPYYHVHRGDLIRILIDAVRREPNITLHTHATVTGCEGSTLLLAGGSIEGDVVIGADGIHSIVRSSIFGAELSRYTGNIAWRGVVPTERLPEGWIRPVTSVWLGHGQHFVHYYIRSGELVNWVGVVEKPGWRVESWLEKGEHAELKSDFCGWGESIRVLIGATDPDACYKWALFDRDPMPCWTVGAAALLGDACHPTLPFMAQGAAMAIEDGAVLAQCLLRHDCPTVALETYASIRQPRTAKVQQSSRLNAKIFHMRPPWSWLRNRLLKHGSAAQMDWLYTYDVYAH
jgi:salicylate hydroxylase